MSSALRGQMMTAVASVGGAARGYAAGKEETWEAEVHSKAQFIASHIMTVVLRSYALGCARY